MGERKKIVLVDGTALAYRNHFSMIKNPLRNSRGINTSALFGTLNSLIKIIGEQKPEHLVVAFDSPKPTFRHKKFPEYKSTRAKMPDELAELLPAIKDAVEAMNIPVFEMDGVEADDVVGTIAEWARKNGFEVIIYTGDKDFIQLIKDGISMLAPGRGNKDDQLWTIQNAHRKFGVRPEQILDLLALMGDSSDNIPGVFGIGKKTATKLLNEYGSLDEIYANIDNIEGAVRKKLEQGKESAYLSRELARIRTDLNIEIDPEQTKLTEPDPDKLMPILKKYELMSLIKRLIPEHRDTDLNEAKQKYHLITSLKELEQVVKELSQSDSICIDTETTSENPMLAELVGVAITDQSGKGYYIPLAHRGDGELFGNQKNLPSQQAKQILQKLFSRPNRKIGQNIKYDMEVLRIAGMEIAGEIFDTMIAGYLLEPGTYQHNLESLAINYLGYRMTTFSDIVGKGKNEITFDYVDLEKACRYACEDVDITMQLAEIFEPKLKELKLWDLFCEVEMPLVPVLVNMEMTGIRLDEAKFAEIRELAEKKLQQTAEKIYEISGEKFNIDSPKQLSEVLFTKMGIPPKKKTKTGYSTDAEVLEQLSMENYEIANFLMEYREMSKLLSTYINSLPELINPATGRIHTSFNQTVTATGRLSSSEPNLQNIPIRSELGAKIREAFVPGSPDWLMLSADYSQVELRLLAHFSGDHNLISAFQQGLDIHSYTASLITGLPMDEITSELRRLAKTVNFGTVYGQGPYGLARQLGITREEASAFINNYFQRYPQVKEYLDSIIDFIEENGYVETIMGRRRYFPEIKSDSFQVREAAKRAGINMPLQGSAADIIKVAMINIHRSLNENGFRAKMLLQVHDELIFEFPADEQDELIELVKSSMENVVQLRVPLVVDIGIGKNWAESHS